MDLKSVVFFIYFDYFFKGAKETHLYQFFSRNQIVDII